MLTVLLGVGGGFIVVPAMIYLLGMSAQVVVGTSLLQILFVTAATTLIHATTTKSVDIVLAGLLLLGSRDRRPVRRPAGAEGEARIAPHVPRHHHPCGRDTDGDRARLAARGNLHGAGAVRRGFAPCFCCCSAPLALGAAEPRLVPDVSQSKIEIRYSFTGAELLLFGAILYPGGRTPTEQRRHRGGGEGAGPAAGGAREAEGGRDLDERRERRASARPRLSTRSPRRGRCRSWSTSARPRSTSSASRTSRCRRAAASRPEVQRRFEAGLIELMQRHQLYIEDPRGVRITDHVLYRGRINIPARVPVGDYTAETFLIKDGRVIAGAVREIEIGKTRLRARRRRRRRPLVLHLRRGRGGAVAASGMGREPGIQERLKSSIPDLIRDP